MNEMETKLALIIGQQALTIAALQVQLEKAQADLKAASPSKPVAVEKVG